MALDLTLARAQKGDAAAFTELMAPREKRVYYTCLRLTGNAQDAQDCAQEAMLKAFRALPGYQAAASLDTWLYRICVNACLDALRRRRPQESLEEMKEGGFEPPDRGLTPYAALEKKERHEALKKALAALPEDLRTALVLFNLQGRSYEEIAQITGVALGTVKSRVSRARERLKEILGQNKELFPQSLVQPGERRAKE